MKNNHNLLLKELTSRYRNNKYDNDLRLLLRDSADTIRELHSRVEMLEKVITEMSNTKNE